MDDLVTKQQVVDRFEALLTPEIPNPGPTPLPDDSAFLSRTDFVSATKLAEVMIQAEIGKFFDFRGTVERA